MQVAVQSDGAWSEFDDVIVEAGAQIQQDMIVNVTSASLYLLAANKVTETKWFTLFVEMFRPAHGPLYWC